MSLLEFQRYSPEENRWIKRGEVKPDAPQTIINVKSDGTKEIILLECLPDGSESSIKRLELDDKSFVQPHRMQVLHIDDSSRLELVTKLGRGGSCEDDNSGY